jgi:hypothetical protein
MLGDRKATKRKPALTAGLFVSMARHGKPTTISVWGSKRVPERLCQMGDPGGSKQMKGARSKIGEDADAVDASVERRERDLGRLRHVPECQQGLRGGGLSFRRNGWELGAHAYQTASTTDGRPFLWCHSEKSGPHSGR